MKLVLVLVGDLVTDVKTVLLRIECDKRQDIVFIPTKHFLAALDANFSHVDVLHVHASLGECLFRKDNNVSSTLRILMITPSISKVCCGVNESYTPKQLVPWYRFRHAYGTTE